MVPLPSVIEGWEDNLKRWPQITNTKVFGDSIASDDKAINN